MDSEERDTNMGPNDPYSKEKFSDIDPDFVSYGKGNDGGGKSSGETKENVGEKGIEKKTAKGGLKDLEGAALGALAGGGLPGVGDKIGGLFHNIGINGSGTAKKKFPIGFITVILIGVIPLMLLLSNIPLLLLKLTDLSFQNIAKIPEKEDIMKEQLAYIDQESLVKGEMPEVHAGELANYGFEVGQETLAGEFVKTNVYLADLEQDLSEVASSSDDYRVNGGSGELSVRFKDKIVKGSDFVATLHSDPEMYGAYLESSTIFAKFIYSTAVSEVFSKVFGITRETFGSWQRTGDEEKDQESFEEKFYKSVDKTSNAYISGYEEGGSSDGNSVNAEGSAESIISRVREMITGDKATEKGAQALNVAVSATIPFKSASIYAAIEEVLQRTILYGGNKTPNMVAGNFASVGSGVQNGGYVSVAPIDQLLKLMGARVETSYRDATTEEEKTVYESMMDNDNFQATLADGGYNMQEVQNFQADSILLSTYTNDNEVINSATAATNGQKKLSVVLGIGSGDAGDAGVLSNARDAVSRAFSLEASDTSRGIIGANLLNGGGPFLFGWIWRQFLAEMPSNQQVIYTYNRDVEEIIARHAEAERAVKSPFDIDSKYTFLGSIVNNVATSILTNRKSISGDITTTSILGTVGSLAKKSADSLMGIVMADGPKDNYANTLGINCNTVNSVKDLEGDLNCYPYRTNVLNYMSNTQEDWDQDSDLTDKAKKYLGLIGEGRNITPGVKDGEICEIYKKEFMADDVWQSLTDLLSKVAGLYDSCSGVPESESLGGGIALTEENDNYPMIKKASGYALYDEVKSIAYGTKSEMATIREEYYAKNPQDESPEGRLARISGLSKEDARLAINYANYLTMLANYHPETRYAFGEKQVNVPIMVEFVDDKEVDSSVYLAWFSKIEYSDVRNRNFVV